MRVLTVFLLLTGALGVTPGFAQQAQSSEDIIKFFGQAADLGASRGICVGTEEECKSKNAAATSAAQAGLDMLINFDLDSAELTPDARAKLAEFAKALQDNRLKSHSFLVEGYTDASGAASYNEGLSQRRAQSVSAFLLANGIEANRLTAIGKGESDPRVANPYDPVNRRVEMRLQLQ
ncbi:MAG: OmpA family protein [Rhizobiaceae bacterium]|nr:OmpA family protein [Rhizobiaceae bacterium]